MKPFYLAIMALAIGCCASTAHAALYTIDYNETTLSSHSVNKFRTASLSEINSASVDFVIKGHTHSIDSHDINFYYEPEINISIGDTAYLISYELGSNFETLHFDLGSDALNSILNTQSLKFDVRGIPSHWYSDKDPEGGDATGFYFLDSVSLNIAPAAVPLPGAVVLFGSGILGLFGFSKKKKASAA